MTQHSSPGDYSLASSVFTSRRGVINMIAQKSAQTVYFYTSNFAVARKLFWKQMPLIAYSPDKCLCVYLIQIHLGYYCTQGNGFWMQRSMLLQSVKKIVDLVVQCFHKSVLP